jgi:hypothetical protein
MTIPRRCFTCSKCGAPYALGGPGALCCSRAMWAQLAPHTAAAAAAPPTGASAQVAAVPLVLTHNGGRHNECQMLHSRGMTVVAAQSLGFRCFGPGSVKQKTALEPSSASAM